MLENIKPLRIIIGKLSHGQDLLEAMTTICIKENITLGRVEGIGAVQRARLGYYNQSAREYQYIEFNNHLEITSLVGNVSVKDDKPFVHAHVTLSDEKGNAFGGHLAQGTRIFACEIIVHVFDGPKLTRSYDDVTGLPLWYG